MKDIRSITYTEWEDFLLSINEKKFRVDDAVAATCTEKGATVSYHCANCDAT